MHDAHAVLVEGLTKSYRGVRAVRGLDLVAPRGRVTALLGPNGAGKTTTVEICEGLRHADGGTVHVLGRHPRRDARQLRHRVGVMLQDGGLPSTVPAGAVLDHVAAMHAHPRDVVPLRRRLGIDTFARTQVRRLSGGQRQRLALAVAVVGRPELVFLDEPSAGMDPQARLAVWDLVRELREQGTAIVVTTHQMVEAEALADHVVVVDHGTTVAAGTTRELLGDGGRTLTVALDLAPASDLLRPGALAAALSAALGGREVHEREAPGTAEVTGDVDPSLVHRVTGWAAEHGHLVTGLTTGSRTLEDVFLELTGRELR